MAAALTEHINNLRAEASATATAHRDRIDAHDLAMQALREFMRERGYASGVGSSRLST